MQHPAAACENFLLNKCLGNIKIFFFSEIFQSIALKPVPVLNHLALVLFLVLLPVLHLAAPDH
jgi:hypothetical protein